ncbi:Peptidyl-prolyl cis-trans isomerase FKBP16-3, chloroplastic [Hordeum vulgare]|uniref:peptidylprolyl isomerase n=1 Tax=Hordeum vulgare subsp. vulgare TaxID=112509 RepID=A0A8I6YMC1_HORVV|nr:peptidyl-prolyl cis-trans isomerase FKBP16-3, chloroplastic isoform X2 [Hordeum vulgare subsp. vulgare]KAE8804933.1 Peptidyl-prolyl cis-trans isomerase FKBP16-3, chloroplastic [Hordeum vulgare]
MAAAASSSASPILLPSGPRGASSRAWFPSGGGRAFVRGGNSWAPCCCRAAAGGSLPQCGGADDNGGGVVTRRGVVGAVALGVSSSAFCLQAALDAVAGGLPPEEKPKLCDAACEAELENLPMVTTESGLQYKDIKVGRGPSPPIGFQVAANCIAMVPNGQIFDSSLEKGQPYIFRVGAGQVIKGLDEGILSMKVGGLRRLYIPGQLAFPKGLTSAPGRPRVAPSSPVVFDVNLLFIPGLDDDE